MLSSLVCRTFLLLVLASGPSLLWSWFTRTKDSSPSTRDTPLESSDWDLVEVSCWSPSTWSHNSWHNKKTNKTENFKKIKKKRKKKYLLKYILFWQKLFFIGYFFKKFFFTFFFKKFFFYLFKLISMLYVWFCFVLLGTLFSVLRFSSGRSEFKSMLFSSIM